MIPIFFSSHLQYSEVASTLFAVGLEKQTDNSLDMAYEVGGYYGDCQDFPSSKYDGTIENIAACSRKFISSSMGKKGVSSSQAIYQEQEIVPVLETVVNCVFF